MKPESAQLKDSVLKYGMPLPRYTSYPTALQFHATHSERTYGIWLAGLPQDEAVSLYVHIPFCPKLCWFCGCHTKITRRYGPITDYLALLKREIESVAASVPHRLAVSHLHFGGGSPSMLSPEDFTALMNTLRAHFDIGADAQIAIEMDPRQTGEARIATYARQGVTRASFGVQDFNDQVLAAVNRQQPFHYTFDALRLCRDYGIDKINMDFIYGLPHQTADSFRQTMDYAVSLNPDRISLFGYAHVPWMKKHMRLIPEKTLPNAPERYDLFEAASEVLEAADYFPIGIDHFAKKEDSLVRAHAENRLHRNFQGYTDDAARTLIGFGISAISKLPQGYAQNTADTPAYRDHINANTLAVRKIRPLSDEDRLRADVIETLMCYLIADIPALCEKHGFPADHLFTEMTALCKLEEDGLLKLHDGGKVTILTRHAARPACAAFDSYLSANDDRPRHAPAI